MNQPFLDESLQHTSVFLRLGKAYNASIQEFETLTGMRAPAWRHVFTLRPDDARDPSNRTLFVPAGSAPPVTPAQTP